MKIGIVCAMQEELDSILSSLDANYKIEKNKEFSTYMMNYHKNELFLILSGIGKVNATIHTQYLIDKYQVDMVINVGVAGCLSEKLTFGDVVVATDLVQHDINVLAFGVPIGQIPRMDVFSFVSDAKLLSCAMTVKLDGFSLVSGRIVSGDQFIDDRDKAKHLAQQFGALACEMEGAAVAHTCYVNKVPFVVIRAMSDLAGREDKVAIHSYDELKDMVAHRSSYVVKQMLLSDLLDKVS